MKKLTPHIVKIGFIFVLISILKSVIPEQTDYLFYFTLLLSFSKFFIFYFLVFKESFYKLSSIWTIAYLALAIDSSALFLTQVGIHQIYPNQKYEDAERAVEKMIKRAEALGERMNAVVKVSAEEKEKVRTEAINASNIDSLAKNFLIELVIDALLASVFLIPFLSKKQIQS
ncbi:MAG: hypothetical protein EAZ55_09870 [Cytophagales bacterium]|nr:MAG: hypothetical protein EAZ55_09870 [Cytophagales bacterium]